MPIRIVPAQKGRRNTPRENRLEELGRVDAEKAYTSKGKRNLRDEKHRIRRELKAGGGIIKGAIKAAKTVAAPGTHIRNVASGIKHGATKLIKGLPKIAKRGWK